MKVTLTRAIWTYAIAAVLVGVLTTAALCADAPKPSYLDTATYTTSAKCKMCHPKINTAWLTTKHASYAKQLPWEAGTDKPVVPAVEVVYRHVTGYNADTKTWAEKGIGCEACHGPGSAHMAATKETRKTTIMDPEDLKTSGQQISVCGRCHGQYTIGDQRAALKYKAGQDLTTTEGFKLDAVQPDKPMQEMNEVIASKHYAKGVVCITCHTAHPTAAAPHSLKQPVNELCASCHKDKTMAGHAPTAAAGATCATCHMPKGAHTFAKSAK